MSVTENTAPIRKKVVLIIQARMGSTRLPGKSMMDLAGSPLVGRILERVKRCQKIDEIILAIPDTEGDSVLAQLAKPYNVKVFLGSENDLLERYYQAALASNADIVGRLPADNATPEPEEIDKIADYHRGLDYPAFSSNLAQINNSGYPDGIGAEMFDFSLLEQARNENHDAALREHVHLNFYNYETGIAKDSIQCPVKTLQCPSEFKRPDLILDVNTQKQYEFMKMLYEALYPQNPNFHITDIISWYDQAYKQ